MTDLNVTDLIGRLIKYRTMLITRGIPMEQAHAHADALLEVLRPYERQPRLWKRPWFVAISGVIIGAALFAAGAITIKLLGG